jgi:branched-chain amino acid transport system substrate-binding protein
MLRRILWLVLALLSNLAWSSGQPVYVAVDAEFGHKTSTSDDAIRLGMEIAIDEINAAGGVLGGRKLELVVTDNRSVPARGVDNFRALAARPDLVGVFAGKFSPVVLAQLPLAHELKLPLLAPWSATDSIIDHDFKPSYTFRLSLRDSWVMQTLFREAESRGLMKLGLLVPNGAWGRGNEAVARRHVEKGSRAKLVKTQWYEWADPDLADEYQALLASGAEALLFIGNEAEGARLVKTIAAQPENKRLPVLTHWGLSGGDFFGLAGPDLFKVNIAMVQTFSFLDPQNARGNALRDAAMKRLHLSDPGKLPSPVGIAHAYDFTHLLALAVNKARSTDRVKIRDALENLGPFDGAVRKYRPPFTRERHEALGPEQLFLVRWREDGALVRAGGK